MSITTKAIVSDPVQVLRSHYVARRKKNSAYSLRAYAKFLGIPSGRLSEITSGKRGIGPKLVRRLGDRLLLSPQETANLIFSQKAFKGKKSYTPDSGDQIVAPDLSLTEDRFNLITEWYHFGILSLMKTDDFKSDSKWIGRRLNISAIEAQDALVRLERLGLIHKVGRSFRRSANMITTTHDISSADLKRSHIESLKRSIDAIVEVPVNHRDISSITIACDPQDLPEVKNRIKEFRRKLHQFMERGAKKEVYELNIQLLPLSQV